MIVGGRHRGVVAACCYIARTYGVRSAMPMFKALKACPEAEVIKPDMKKYEGGRPRGPRDDAGMHALGGSRSPSTRRSWTSPAPRRLHRASAAETLAGLARRVEEALSITVSIGLSYNRFLAKIASDLDKPRGFAVIGRAEARVVPRRQAGGVAVGCGGGHAETPRARRHHFASASSPASTRRRSSPATARSASDSTMCARGEDDRRVNPERETKSISSEITLDEDVSDPAKDCARSSGA